MAYDPFDPYSQDPYQQPYQPPPGPTPAPQGPPAIANSAPVPAPPNTGVTAGFGAWGVEGGGPAPSPAPSAPPSSAAAAPFNYERARDSWMSGQYGTGEAGARAWAAANGVPYGGGDTITLPNGGGQIDIIGNFQRGAGTNMRNNWTPAGGNGPNPGGQGSGGGFGGGGSFGSGNAQSSYGITSGPLQDQYRATLLHLMQQGEQPVDEQSLGIQQPYQAARLASERQLEQAQQANAERLYAQGQLGSNELGQMNQQGRERAAVGLGQLKAGLVGNEIAARRQQLHQALQLANAVGARQEAMQLQRELAQMENQYRYSALGQQASQFGEDLGERRAQFIQQMNQNAALAGLGG